MVAAVVGHVALPSPAFAADGSGTSNADLLRGTVSPGCTNSLLCPPIKSGVQLPAAPSYSPGPRVSNNAPANCQALITAGIYAPECSAVQTDLSGLGMGSTPATQSRTDAPISISLPQPVATVELAPPVVVDPTTTASIDEGGWKAGVLEADDDAVIADWAITLRGATVVDNAGQTYELVLQPRGSIILQGSRGTTTLSADTEFTQSSDGTFRVGAGNFSASGTHAINRETRGTAALRLSLSQESDGTSNLGTIQNYPFVASGQAELGITRSFGRFEAGFGGQLRRQYVSETGLTNGTWVSNAHRGLWDAGANVRASYELTPIIGVFSQASATRSQFDVPSPTSGVLEDGWTYVARGGMTGSWRHGVDAQIYAGYAFRQFDSASLTSAGDWIYGGNLVYAPRSGLTFSAALESSISAAGDQTGASTRFDHSIDIGSNYKINDRFTVRTSLGARWASFAGSANLERGYSAGAGLDYQMGKNTLLNADYALSYEDKSGVQNTTHRASVGVTLRR